MKKLKGLAGMKSAGAIRDLAPVMQTIDWKGDDGEDYVIDVYVKPMAFGMAMDLQLDDSPDKRAAAIGQMILVEEGGKLVALGAENARALNSQLGFKLLVAINQAMGGEAKNSRPPTNSSANSSSTASAAEPSQKPATT
ncbi:MAG: hypothetical protein DI587_38055 [Variovorax paradoxus]|nr:MAG: hypothetical protein DI583_38055 [Variovorax paradoxus]PZP99800.1 MAG: hypothetical protein DI587_38055 [Variovorax paradoxus]